MLDYVDDIKYRIFVTESLRYAPQSKYLTTTLLEMLGEKVKDERTAEQIAQDVIVRHGIKVNG